VVPGLNARSPHPYSVVLSGSGLMCGTKDRQTEEYVSYKPPDQSQVSVDSFGYGADNPAFGATSSYKAFPRGMGLREQRAQNAADDEQYDHALGVDASVYPVVKGPELAAFTPATTDATNGVVGFIRVGASFYAVTGRYALVRSSDASWPVQQDFGAGKVALDAAAFYSNGVGAAYGFVAMGDADNLWSVTASSWTQHASLKAIAFGRTGREFFKAASVNVLSKVDTDSDPTVAANWGNANAFTVGDKSSAIVRLPTTASGLLLAVKTDGVYTLDAAGDDVLLAPYLPEASNGKALARWGNDLYLGFTHGGFWKFDEDGASREQVGPELLTDGSSVVAGYLTAAEGTAFALYGAVYNPDSGLSYLCKFLGMTAGPGGRRVPVWHGSLSQPLAARVTAMRVDTAGAPTGHARLYLGFSNGTLGWFTLPCTPHPADCTEYRFSTVDGTLELPTWTGGFPANAKALDGITCTARNFSGANYVSVATRTDPVGAYTAMADNFDSGQREKVEFPAGASATVLDVRATLVSAASTASPQVTGIGIHHQVHTPYRSVFEIRVLAEDGLRRRDGTPMAIGRDRITDVVTAAANSPGSIPLVLPEGNAVQIRVKGVRADVAWDQAMKRPRRAYVLEAVEVTTLAVAGTHARMMSLGSHAALMAYSHQQLQSL
jgi:hypothetical protein